MAVPYDIYKAVMDMYAGQCAECGATDNFEIHHKISNSKVNRRKYPLLIDSPLNLIPLCNNMENGCHEKTKHIHKIREREADTLEAWLQDLAEGMRP